MSYINNQESNFLSYDDMFPSSNYDETFRFENDMCQFDQPNQLIDSIELENQTDSYSGSYSYDKNAINHLSNNKNEAAYSSQQYNQNEYANSSMSNQPYTLFRNGNASINCDPNMSSFSGNSPIMSQPGVMNMTCNSISNDQSPEFDCSLESQTNALSVKKRTCKKLDKSIFGKSCRKLIYKKGPECKKMKDNYGHYDEQFDNCRIYNGFGKPPKQFFIDLGNQYNKDFEKQIANKEMPKFTRECKRNMGLAVWFFEDILVAIYPWLVAVRNFNFILLNI